MTSFQDLQKAQIEKRLDDFIIKTVDGYDLTELKNAALYYKGENPELTAWVSNITLDDNNTINLTPKFKIYSSFLKKIAGRIVGRLWQVPVQVDNHKDKLGKDFDVKVLQIATYAAVHGVCYAFMNHDKIQMFKATEFLPLLDERTGAHRAGIRFYRINAKKPWVIQLYETDGFIEWKREPHGDKLIPVDAYGNIAGAAVKQPYRTKIPAGGAGYIETMQITQGENYPDFPIVPLYINQDHASELTLPIKSKINYYDAKETAYNDEALREKLFYWTVEGYGGNAAELSTMIKTVRELGIVAAHGDETKVKAESSEAPYLSHNATMERIENAIYRDACIMNPRELTGGSLTNVAIMTAMIEENTKMVGVENEAKEFIRRLLTLSGVNIESNQIKFTHTTIANEEEITRRLVQWISSGNVPAEELAALEPLFIRAGIEKQIRAAIEKAAIGMSNGDLEEYERRIKEAREAQKGGEPLDGQNDE